MEFFEALAGVVVLELVFAVAAGVVIWWMLCHSDRAFEEFEAFADASERLRDALLEAIEPIVQPLVESLMRLMRRIAGVRLP